jgi:uncharacterized protein
MAERRARAWQRMLSGRRLDLLDPSPLDVEIGDIAHGLARVSRWNGQTLGDHAFSVAQHCLLVERIAALQDPQTPARDLLATLLHDAPEYVIGDMISPLKRFVGGDYKAVEARLLQAIHIRFGLPADLPGRLHARIKQADQAAAWLEAVHLAGFSHREAARYFGRPPDAARPDIAALLEPWPARRAQSAYLDRFAALAPAAVIAACSDRQVQGKAG